MNASFLRWRDLSLAAGPWQALHPAPAENRGFTERGRYRFEVPGPGWRLRIDDGPLTEASSGTMQWEWEPGFFAGEVTAELEGPAASDRTLFLLDVGPDPTKLGREVFGRMLQELMHEAPELVVGAEPATMRIGQLGEFENAWLAFARVRRYCPDVLRAIAQLRARPRRTLRVWRASSPLHQVRRVDRQTAAILARSLGAAVLLDDPPGDDFAAASRLDVPVVEETLDSAANRAVLALLLALVRRACGVLERLQGLVDREQDSETRTSLATRWPRRRQVLEETATRLKLAVRQSPFASVTRPEITAAGLNAVAADPIYARAWERGWRALRPGIEVGGANERLWVSPSWEVYEGWCFIRLGRSLQAALPGWGWSRRGRRWIGSSGGRAAELVLQQTFECREREMDGPWSVSRERVPDLVLRVGSRTGTRFVVLDVKYRASRSNVLDAMTSAHVYQDSLRIGSRRPDATLLLVPAGGGATWLEDSAFQAAHRVGVHVFSPDTATALPWPLIEALQGGA